MEINLSNECLVASDEPPPVSEEDAPCRVTTAAPSSDRLSAWRENPRWEDWRWQIRNRIRSFDQLTQVFPSLRGDARIARVAGKYPMAITPYYAAAIHRADYGDPVFRMAVPQVAELEDPPFLHADPLAEDEDMPVPGLVHRYRDRALLIATTMCSMYCRHCTRKRVAGTRESSISPCRLRQVVQYLSAHPEINDVVISGGDPLTMATPLLERILMALRSVPTVEIIRIGTRTPVVLPMRITEELTSMLRKYLPIWVNTHFNHPNELTPEAKAACGRLVDAGIPLSNQSVLLRGINDDPHLMEALCRALVRARVRPYYLFQCDLVRGVEHFRTPLSRGIEIMEYLRGRLSGLAIPTFVVDAPHGGGKIPVLPSYVISSSPTNTVLRNYEGMIVNYPEPAYPQPACIDVPEASHTSGVWEVAAGKASAIVPVDSHVHRRRQARGAAPARRESPRTDYIM